MKLTLTTNLKLDSEVDITVTSTVDAFSDNWGDSRDHWLERHTHAVGALSSYDLDIRKHADVRERAWDECLDAIERNELNIDQAREGNPYRTSPSTGRANR